MLKTVHAERVCALICFWWRRSTRNTSKYDANVVVKLILSTGSGIRVQYRSELAKNRETPAAMQKNQKVNTTFITRASVTTSLYRRCRVRASTLSTAIVAIVMTDTPAHTKPAIQWMSLPLQAVLWSYFNSATLYRTSNGWAKRPMTKSEHARQQIRILEAEWRSGVFQIINTTNMLNDTAVTENKEFRTQIRISEIGAFPLCVKSTVSKKKHVWTKLLFLASISTAELLQNDLENSQVEPVRTLKSLPRPIYSDNISHDQRRKAMTKRPQV